MNQIDVGWMAGIIDGEGSLVLVEGSYARKSDGLKTISPRILMAVTDFQILFKYTSILSEWGINYTYVPQFTTRPGDWSPKVNVNIHRLGDVIKFLDIVVPHLSLKRERGELVRELAQWRLNHQKELMHRYGSVNDDLRKEEREFWFRYRTVYAGRGGAVRKSRERSLKDAVLIANVPIFFKD